MNERMKLTELEKQVLNNHPESMTTMFMGQDINEALDRDTISKFNTNLEQFSEKLEEQNKEIEKDQESLQYDINKAEIKPLFARVLIKPFKNNPFQKMVVENGLITDTGGYTPNYEINPNTGKYEKQKEFIVTGVIVEVGPECKYLQEGDVVYYRVDTVVPVPFFRQGLVSLSENQVICAVNEGLEKRFKNGK